MSTETEQYTTRILEVYRGDRFDDVPTSEVVTRTRGGCGIGRIVRSRGQWWEVVGWSKADPGDDYDAIAFLVPASPPHAVRAAQEGLDGVRRGPVVRRVRGLALTVCALGLVAWECGRLAIEAVGLRRGDE